MIRGLFGVLCFYIGIGSLLGQSKSVTINLDELMAKMTLEEKVGQMLNLTLATVAKEKDNPITLDSAKLRDVLIKHHTGNIQNVINHAYTLTEWHSLVNTIQSIAIKESRLKIPMMYCIDAVHGTNFTLGSTLFPHNLGLAATRNPALVQQCSEITAKEVRASGIRYNFSPVLDVGRQPLWPRFAETFGEDTYLVKTLGTASVKGYEGTDLKSVNGVAACMKHFVGYSHPASGKDRAPAYIPDIVLREYYLPTFQSAIDAGARTLMVNSADVNGRPLHASKYWLTEVLRNELGFKGMVISDWEDVKKLHERHRIADSQKEAVRIAVEAGIDMCIVPYDFTFSDYLIELVKEGKIPESRINASVKRILQLKQELGLFDQPYVEKEAIKNFGLPEYSAIALEAARESITLLKNEKGVLPLPKNKKVLVTGPSANSVTALHGAWSYTWQGQKPQYFSPTTKSILEAVKQKIGANNAVYFKGTGFDTLQDHVAALQAANSVDYIVVCLGEEAYAETPGNIHDLELPEAQRTFIKDLAKTGKPIVLVLTEGRPRIINKIEPFAQGIILTYWPGSQGANALADILFGDYNPNGKLPFTYPRFIGDLLTYDHKLLDEAVEVQEPYSYTYKFNPQFQFGHGLSYTAFTYSNLTLNTQTLTGNNPLQVSVTVKNSGSIAGKETIELYSKDIFASITPPVKRLRRFSKIALNAGESKTVTFQIDAQDLSFMNNDLKRVTENGDFEIIVGPLKQKFVYLEK
jgi:beta-glucosidase